MATGGTDGGRPTQDRESREGRDRFSRSPTDALSEAVNTAKPVAEQPPPDAKGQAIEHGVEEYYREAAPAADGNPVQRVGEETRVTGQPDRPDA